MNSPYKILRWDVILKGNIKIPIIYIAPDLAFLEFVRRNDSIFHRVFAIAKDTGFFSIVLGYNPGGTGHGSQKIDVGNKKCTHKLATLCQSINNGASTLNRAKNRGFKIWISPQPSKLEYWIYDNRCYFFTVVP